MTTHNNPKKIKLLFCRYDLMNNGYLTYDDFYNMIVPYDSKYREMVERRKLGMRVENINKLNVRKLEKFREKNIDKLKKYQKNN